MAFCMESGIFQLFSVVNLPPDLAGGFCGSSGFKFPCRQNGFPEKCLLNFFKLHFLLLIMGEEGLYESLSQLTESAGAEACMCVFLYFFHLALFENDLKYVSSS